MAGTTGSGKTLFAAEFLARGITKFGEPGVFVTFEESPSDIRTNFASLGFPIAQWESEGKWAFVDAAVTTAEMPPVVGAYDFGALAARIRHAADRIGASRVAMDSLGAIFTRFANSAIVRQELARISDILREDGVTSVVTAERTHEHDGVSRYGVEEFVLDNVIILRNVLAGERRRRTIEIVKFRGAAHRTGEWLFTIDPGEGLIVIPLAFLGHPATPASQVRVSTGNPGLDEMCGGGIYKDAIILFTGPSGAGKTLASLKFVAAGVAAGERCLAFTFDETRGQVVRTAAGWGGLQDGDGPPDLAGILVEPECNSDVGEAGDLTGDRGCEHGGEPAGGRRCEQSRDLALSGDRAQRDHEVQQRAGGDDALERGQGVEDQSLRREVGYGPSDPDEVVFQ